MELTPTRGLTAPRHPIPPSPRVMKDRFSIFDRLHQLSSNLLWMSETDAPFEVFAWSDGEEMTPKNLLQKIDRALDTTVKMVDLDKFFKNAIAEQDWYDEEEREIAQRYRSLVETLKQSLSKIKVYQVGQTEIDVYIVGQLPSGNWVGLSTKVVET
ncbi:nuclease A inhibitor family protein [Lusitaniella coriacea]|uniref:nuclease A inhibitor family protein n=1 Tax=Lusitaniella coriacea TaxID=1983105 RepID=UPI003CEBDBE6